ncbi:MAG: hypothetical protein P9M00_04240 [Candidatus Tritonobacter lacicola]|nr:hypothetical protein [Candidatus Tritonobacter lacicola]
MDRSDSVFLEKLLSGLTGDESRSLSSLFNDVRGTPKADLHFHLAGSIRPRTLLDLAMSDGEPIDWSMANSILQAEEDIGAVVRRGGLQKVKELLEYRENPGSLQGYLNRYSIAQTVLASSRAVRRVAYEAAESAYADGVRKIEIRFNPIRLDGNILPVEMARAVSEGLLEAERNFPGLKTGLIVCVNKMFSRDEVAEIVEMTVDMVKHGGLDGRIVAVDTSGPEIGFEPEKFAGPFRLARERGGLGVVCHAGEDFLAIEDGLEAIEKAVTLLGARRIGHGLAAGLKLETLLGTADGNGNVYSKDRLECVGKKQDEVLHRMADSDVCVEVCPSSNMHTGKVANIGKHPIEQFLRSGVPVAICTDNTTISHTKLSWEHLRIAKAFGYGFDTISGIIDTCNAYSYV